MTRLAAGVVGLLAAALVSSGTVAPVAAASAAGTPKPSACNPSTKPLLARGAAVPGLTDQQVRVATEIINAGAKLKVPQHGQTLAVTAALEASDLGARTGSGGGPTPVFGVGSLDLAANSRTDPVASAQHFYGALTKVENWQQLPPTLAVHAAQRNLDPQAYQRWWAKAGTIMNTLTSGTGIAGLRNLAARAQQVADCEQATLKGRFAVSNFVTHVGPLPPDLLVSRAVDLAQAGDPVWHDRCQAFVAYLDGRPSSGYSTALDAWQTFEAQGVAHPVTSPDGVAPPPGAWLYYVSSNPAGHVATYLGNGQVASTDVFADGRIGVGPASALTDGPWHLQYLGWAPPWGAA